AAIEIPSSAERRAYADEACGGDTSLRAQVDALLEAHEAAGSFLATPALTPAARHGSPPVTEGPGSAIAHDPGLPGRAGAPAEPAAAGGPPLDFLAPPEQPEQLGRLGHYEVLEVIGRGGMGIVLRAFDSKLHRVVAIKVIAAQPAANVMARRRFIRE